MTEKAFRQLNIDPEFKNLIRPLRREEYRQLAEVHAEAVLEPSGGNKKIML